MKGYKVLTEDWCSPIQDSENKNPLLPKGTKLPFTLPKVEVDLDVNNECSFGWNFCDSIIKAANITKLVSKYGMNRVLVVESKDIDAVKEVNNKKIRSSQIRLIKNVSRADIKDFHKHYKIDNDLADDELYRWLTVARKEENDEQIIKYLKKALVGKMKIWIVIKGDYNNYYYNNYYNYYNNYYYIIETIFAAIHNPKELNVKKYIRSAYSYGMRQLRFKDNQLIYYTKSDLQKFI